MKIAIWIIIILLVAWFLFIGQAKITLNPFSFSMEYWWRALGYAFIGLGLVLLSVGEYHRGRMKGYGEGVNMCIEHLEKEIKEETK